jgi:hypothetical protein
MQHIRLKDNPFLSDPYINKCQTISIEYSPAYWKTKINMRRHLLISAFPLVGKGDEVPIVVLY